MWLAYILVFQNEKPVMSIFCVMVQALIMIAVTGLAEPMIRISDNRIQIFHLVLGPNILLSPVAAY